MSFSKAIQGDSGLWFKYKVTKDGTKHLLVSETKEGLKAKNFFSGKNVGHDHYWYKNGKYYQQMRTNNTSALMANKGKHKQHLFKINTPFSGQNDKGLTKALDNLFDFEYLKKLEAQQYRNNTNQSQVPKTRIISSNTSTNNFSITSNKKTNSMSSQRLNVQLQQLQELGKFLQKFDQILQKNKQDYTKRLEALSQSGLAQEVEQNYGPNYATPKLKAIDQIVNDISTRDIPYVKKNLQAIQQAINAAKS